MGFRWQPTTVADVGIDGEIEICDPLTEEAQNQFIKVQSKAGPSYFQSEDKRSFTYYPSPKDMAYWRSGSVPLIIVFFREKPEEAFWFKVDKGRAVVKSESAQLRINKSGQRFAKSAAAKLRKIAAEPERRVLVEIVIDGMLSDVSESFLSKLVDRIKSIGTTDVRVHFTGSGSIKLVLELTESGSRSLAGAIRRGDLEEFRVRRSATILITDEIKTLQSPIPLDTVLAYGPEDEDATLVNAEELAAEGLSVGLRRLPTEGYETRQPSDSLFGIPSATGIVIGSGGLHPWTNRFASEWISEKSFGGSRLIPIALESAPPRLQIPMSWRALSIRRLGGENHRARVTALANDVRWGPQRNPLNLELVICLDTTSSMTPILDRVKQETQILINQLQALTEQGDTIRSLRVKLIAFRDVYVDATDAFRQYDFFSLPNERDRFESIVSNLEPEGGGDAPENGLESVSLAMSSEWSKPSRGLRQLIILFTDAAAHPLAMEGTKGIPAKYPAGMPHSLQQMKEIWEKWSAEGRRLVLVAPKEYPWLEMSEWENVAHVEMKQETLRSIGTLAQMLMMEIR